ncbi:MAG: helix-turn-helix domain-containing protein [Pararhodobacter sp.]|nr:helix-turn-helix domain-containing protein [Pararhodobacter sp.]
MIWRKEQPPAHQEQQQPRGFDDYELRLGDLLRGERATLNKSLLDVQRELHIRASYIAAIENGDLSAFETPGFVAGFVRSYARYLGMDPEWVYQRFCQEHGFAVQHGMTGLGGDPGLGSVLRVEDTSQRRQTGGMSPGGALKGVGLLPDPEPFWHRIEPGALGSVSILAALILGLGFAGWKVLQEVQRVQLAPADFAPTVLSDIDPLATSDGAVSRSQATADPWRSDRAPGQGGAGQDDTRRETAGQDDARRGTGSAEGHVRIARPQALDSPVMVPRDGPIAAISPREGRSPDTISADHAVAEALAEALAEGESAPAPQVLGGGPASVEILAVRPSWVRVRGADNSVIFERILDAGERYTIPQTEVPPTLHAGNSGSVYFLIDGQPFGPAAPGAQVVRNLTLSVDSLQERFAEADLSRDSDLAVLVAELRDEAN